MNDINWEKTFPTIPGLSSFTQETYPDLKLGGSARSSAATPGMELLRFFRDTGPLHAMLWQHLELAVEQWPKVLSGVVRRCKALVSWSIKESWPKSVPLRPGGPVRFFSCVGARHKLVLFGKP